MLCEIALMKKKGGSMFQKTFVVESGSDSHMVMLLKQTSNMGVFRFSDFSQSIHSIEHIKMFGI